MGNNQVYEKNINNVDLMIIKKNTGIELKNKLKTR